MGERPTGWPEYERLTPHELNGELKRVYDSLPTFYLLITDPEAPLHGMSTAQATQATAERILTDEERRKKGEYRQVIGRKLTTLLQHAPITDSFKEAILGEFDIGSTMGVNKESAAMIGFFGRLFDQSKDEGIFGASAQEIEKACYQYSEQQNSVIEDALGAFTPEELAEAEAILTAARGRETKLAPSLVSVPKWRLEYIEKYGKEP